MKRFLLLATLVCAAMFSACEYDDSALWGEIDGVKQELADHERRIAALEELCKQMNTNISALQTAVTALQNNDFVTNVAPITKDGETIGYTVTFSKSGSITIYNGEDGKDGADGEDAVAPVIGVKQDSDGVYYWTLDGEWLTDDSGNKIKAEGKDGKDGEDATDGEDGVTPQLKIEDDYWYVSYDNGATWKRLGKATGNSSTNVTDCNCIIKDVRQDDNNVYFELTDGTIITIPKSNGENNSGDDGDDNTGNGGNTEIPIIPDQNAVEISNNGFEDAVEVDGQWSIKDWTINRNYGPRANNQKASVSIVDGAGRNNTRALKIQQLPSNGKCCVVLERELTGLEPDMMYRMTASLRYSDIPNNEGYGPVLFSPNTKQYWNSSKYFYGTELGNWTTTYVDFLTDDNGKAKICIGLGFWLGGAANGGYSTGTVYWDHVTVTKVTTQMYMRESEHMRVWFEPGLMSTSSAVIDEWLSKVDKMYESYAELMGDVPHEGRKLGIMTTRGMYAGYWALAGYPILWGANGSGPSSTFPQLAEGTMSFGLMHEIGHVFNIGKSNWNWNDEMFANFRMQYGLEMNDFSVQQRGAKDEKEKVYTGREILDMYKQDYEKTLNNPGGMNDNAVHYVLGRMAGDEYLGWDVFCATFKRLQQNGYSGNSNGWYKFQNFVNTLSECATEIKGREIDAWQYINTTEKESIKRKWQ